MQDNNESSGATRNDFPSANRGVEIKGSVVNSVIITGDGNQVFLEYGEQFHYQVLDENFRNAQLKSAPADFYNGTRPNWGNIIRGDDAPRNLYGEAKAFVEDQSLPAQRMCIVTGPSGEGKTTFLMRLAWDLAEGGYPVFWRHFGKVSQTSSVDYQSTRPVILCFDQAGDDTQLPLLVRDLCQFGVPFIILATERQNEWQSTGLESEIRRSIHFKTFAMPRLTKDEVVSLLDCLEKASQLDALAGISKKQRVKHFLNRLDADGQLLPALLTAKTGKHSLDAIVLNMLERIKRQKDGDFLIKSYVLIASVHRWGRSLSSSLLARCLEIDEEDIRPRLLRYLSGEVSELMLGENVQLYTRHPFIANKAFELADSNYLVQEGKEIYKKLLRAVGQCNAEDKAGEQKLLTIIPISHKRMGDVNTARILFNESTRANPTNAPTWQAWALMEKELGNYSEARRLFKESTMAAPLDAPSWQAWALMEKELGNIDEAHSLFKEATIAVPQDAPSWQAWALMKREHGDYDEARHLFRKATEMDPKHVPAWQSWALMEKELGKYEEARRLFKKATEVDPYSAFGWQPWALMEKELGNYEEARRLFRESTRAALRDAPSWQAWALMEKQLGNIDQARYLFGTSTKADPKHAPSWQAWALMEKELGNHKEALRLVRMATEADPKNAPSWQAWALMEKELGNYEEARQLFKKATEVDPKHAPAWQPWAVMEKELGNYEEARFLFRKVTEVDINSAFGWQPWALMEKELGNYEEARRLFKKATEADPNSAFGWQAWALMEKELGNYEEARQLFEAAVKADSNQASAWQAWSLLEMEMKNLDTALAYAKRAVELRPRDFYPYIARGHVFLASQKPKEAKTDLDMAKSLIQKRLLNQKRNAKLLIVYGEVLIALQEYEKTREIANQVLGLSTVHNKHLVHILLGKLYAAQNQIQQALNEFETALRYAPSNLEAKSFLKKLRTK